MSDREYSALLEQYKLCVEMADRVSQRRDTANAYFLTINTFLISGLAALWAVLPANVVFKLALLAAIAGLALAFVWWRVVLSHKGLNTGKFAVIHALERRLPAQPYADEWRALGEGKSPSKYWPISHLEMTVPLVFAGIYAAVVILGYFVLR